ncbi:MAG: CHAT domain-containing protein [Planctomycetaceae bacterium]|nr:CHAT domain-containing protein [Planctomycetaceae bacterium]
MINKTRWVAVFTVLLMHSGLPAIGEAANGHMVRVTEASGQIKDGNSVLANVARGTQLYVYEVQNGEWAKVRVPGQEAKGWIHRSQIEIVPISQADEQRLQKVRDLFQQYQQQVSQKEFQASEESIRQILALLVQVYRNEHPQVADAHEVLGGHLYQKGDYPGAIEQFSSALSIRQAILGESDPESMQSMHSLAGVLNLAGEYERALPIQERVLQLRNQTLGPAHADTLASLNNLTTIFVSLGRLEEAKARHEQSLQLFREQLGEDHQYTLTAMTNLADVHALLHDYTTARMLLEQALRKQRQVLGESHRDTLQTCDQLGVVLLKLNDLVDARSLLEEAASQRITTIGENHPDTLRTQNSLAIALLRLRQPGPARDLLQRVLERQRAVLGDKHPDTLRTTGNLAVAFDDMEDHEAAESLHSQVWTQYAAVFGPEHPTTLDAVINLGNAEFDQGKVADAMGHWQLATNSLRQSAGVDHPATMDAMGNLIVGSLKQGDVQTALTFMHELRQAQRSYVSRLLPGLSTAEQLQFLAVDYLDEFHRDLSVGQQYAQTFPAVLEQSSEWLINGKAIAQEALAEHGRLAEGTSNVATELTTIRGQLARLAVSQVEPHLQKRHQQRLADLEEKEQQLARQLRQQSGISAESASWVEIDDVRSQLSEGSVFVDIVRLHPYSIESNKYHESRYVAWVTHPGGEGEVEIHDLGSASSIDAAVLAAREAMNESPDLIDRWGPKDAEQAVHQPLRQLAIQLFDPLLRKTGDARRLIISPDSSLWLVPWSALPLSDGRYAVEEYEISYVVSGRDLAAPPSTSAPQSSPVIFADPDYNLIPTPLNERPSSSRFVGSFDDLQAVDRLPGTAQEAAAITPLIQQHTGLRPTVHLEAAAREETFKQLSHPPVLVLSTHGYYLEDQQVELSEPLARIAKDSVPVTKNGTLIENPLLRCGLLLAGCNKRKQLSGAVDDGVLTGMEVVSSDLNGTGLVVLSACETGIGEIQNGEGVAGLRQAFQIAGAESVLATLWQIPDAQTAELMQDFFKNLVTGQSRSQAVRAGQLALLADLRREYHTGHPYYWAAFTLTGTAD